ncbi:MAG: RNA polymerase sigma-70 factor [Odoribacteraceae bacterium]|jgi:RNA polymerase sigma-70 factor (ECF subfamily)|nr:RNA polymerase sigma-70 factor [Odoribacteraceae bacterium]
MKMDIPGTREDASERDGAVRSFRELFMAWYPRLVYFSWRLVGDRPEAEDIAQEAFASYWSRRAGVSGEEAAIKGYLYETARNLCLNHLRRRAVERGYRERGAGSDSDTDEMNALVSAEVLAAIYQAIGTLPARCREIVTMAYVEGLKNREIAERCHLSIHTVRAQKQRAIHLLKERLGREALLLLLLVARGKGKPGSSEEEGEQVFQEFS